MIHTIKRIFGATPEQIMDQAILRAAHLAAETEKSRISMSMYSLLLEDTDPHTDWWRFADLKQKHMDAFTEYTFLVEHSMKSIDVIDKLRGIYHDQTLKISNT